MVPMGMKKDVIIVMRGNKKITRKSLFQKKERFHKQLARLPFEEKIRILIRLQKIADSVLRLPPNKRKAWKIPA
jgi:hypothetical protein